MVSAHKPRKRFGQNFLHDPGIVERISSAIAPQPGQQLVEIGPGLGALTRPLLRATGHLRVIELDRDLIPQLTRICQGLGELQIHQADALSFDFTRLPRAPQRLRIVGNLPYNISTALIFHLLTQAACIEDMHFMLQKEVVERMAAAPGGADYGRLSVMVQYHCRVLPLFQVSAGAFRPTPKVESTFVRLLPYRESPVYIHDQQRFAALVKQAFSQRRKTLRNSLRGMLAEQSIAGAGIEPGARPQSLNLAQFAALSNAEE